MRSLNYAEPGEVEALKAEPWQIDLLSLNPGYVFWGNGEDYMWKKRDTGWDSELETETWKKFELELDELNEVVNFYFFVRRESRDCQACNGGGLNSATRQIAEDWYDFANTGRKWNNRITDHEVMALAKSGRLNDWFRPTDTLWRWEESDEWWVTLDLSVPQPEREWVPAERTPILPSAEEVNAAQDQRGGAFRQHDAINRWICVKARAEREGVYGKCEEPGCENGTYYTADHAHVGLQLWVLHPRKGASRGWRINNIDQEDLPSVFAFLREAAERNSERFAKVTERSLQ